MARAGRCGKWWWGVRAASIDVLIFVVALTCGARTVSAQITFPSIVERVTGVRLDAAPIDGGGDRARVECGDVELFGIAGLRASGVRGTVPVRGVRIGAEVSQVGSPVGSHVRATATAGIAAGRWRTAVRAGVESLSLAGGPSQPATVTALVSGVDVGDTSLRADVESIAGWSGRATFMTVALAARLAGHATVVSSLRFDGPGSLALVVAAIVPLHARLSVLAGYDDGTETLSAGVTVNAGRCTLATGVFRHAVLGPSQGVSVAVNL